MPQVRQPAHGADAVGSDAGAAGERWLRFVRLRPRRWVLRIVKAPLRVRIIGVPTAACGGGVGDAWRATAAWATSQLAARFGDTVRVEYFDLLDPDCPSLPPGAQLPLVSVGDQVLSSGGKISLPAIRRQLEALGAEPPKNVGGA